MSLDLYPPGVFDSDKSGIDPSSVDDICSSIHDATKGFGTNEKYAVHLFIRISTLLKSIV